jgi:hypothetical protein
MELRLLLAVRRNHLFLSIGAASPRSVSSICSEFLSGGTHLDCIDDISIYTGGRRPIALCCLSSNMC